MDPSLQSHLESALRSATDSELRITGSTPVSGGCIHAAYRLKSESRDYFLKHNRADRLPVFRAEAKALKQIAATETLRVPQVITVGSFEDHAYLLMEAIDFSSGGNPDWGQLGRKLAQLHRATSGQYGFIEDNWIGANPQPNAWETDWPTFFRERRLRPQFELAARAGIRFQQTEKLLDKIESQLSGHRPKASLLHGDLWSGNVGFTEKGEPLVFDPASYYGDRETDIAFSEYFGGFSPDFYEAYTAEWPLDPGYKTRRPLYNLYHVLNHANLFGSSYVSEAQQMIDDLV